MLSTPDRILDGTYTRPGIDQLNAAIIPAQRDLLAKLQIGLGQIFESVFPGLEFPEEFRANSRILRQTNWMVTAVPWDPDGVLVHVNQIEDRIKDRTGALQIGCSGDGLLFVSARTKLFEQQIGQEIGDWEAPLREAMKKAKKHPRITLFGHI